MVDTNTNTNTNTETGENRPADPDRDDESGSGETDIRQLDEDTVARIAAGEVVERPASAVKELVENSLDANASRISVEIEEGGTELIRVSDDGRGMTEADVRAAIRQHTTSKIGDLDDLETGVETLGFRGEALHTIGAVARLEIETRPRGESGAGTKLVYEGGTVEAVGPTGCPEGTAVTVTDLFYNTPARRKFLKTTATEFAHVNRVVTRYALANPDVAMTLTHDGREVFATTGQGDRRAAVLSVYGRDVAQSMIAVSAESAGDSASGSDGEGDSDGEADDSVTALPAGPLESVTGLVSHPETNRSTREYLATYVNGRAVTSDAIRSGIMGAYGTQLGGNRYPFVVLFLEVPGAAIDVNVHPRKREVRFDDDDAVRRQVEAAVEDALLDHGLLRSGAPRGRSAPDEATVKPKRRSSPDDSVVESAREPNRDADLADPADEPPTRPTASGSSATRDETGTPSAEGSSQSERGDNATETGAGTENRSRPSTASGTNADRIHGIRSTRQPVATDDVANANTGTDESTAERGDSSSATTSTSYPHGETSTASPTRKFDEVGEQRTLAGEPAIGDVSRFESLPSLRILGQAHDTYIVCETPDGLALIDQHAADERVNYERLRDAFDENPPAQALASPVELELTATETVTFDAYREALSRLGFYADRVDDRTISVTTVPAVFDETIEPARLRDVLASMLEGDRDAGGETIDALADEFLGDLACYPAVTGNTSLTEGSLIDLLTALDECDNPYSCPHGRPVFVQLDADEIEGRFERDYPGHSG